MSESEAWGLVYSSPQPSVPKQPAPLKICFTGFSDSDNANLASIALKAGLRVTSSVPKSLNLLCIGSNAGPSKLEAARAMGVIVIDRERFHEFLETGELPRV
jgi:BRCT domain type II-containing protein